MTADIDGQTALDVRAVINETHATLARLLQKLLHGPSCAACDRKLDCRYVNTAANRYRSLGVVARQCD
jgi:hypothetical protein